MPVFLVERSFAEKLQLSGEEVRALEDAADDAGLRWLESFLSADRLRSYCLYEAPSAEALRVASERVGMPIDTIIEVTEMFGSLAGGGAFSR